MKDMKASARARLAYPPLAAAAALALTFAATPSAAARGAKGSVSGGAQQVGACSVASVEARFRFSSFFGEPVVNTTFAWTAGHGTSPTCLHTAPTLEISGSNGAKYYWHVDSAIPRAGGHWGYSAAGSPSWAKVFCSLDRSRCLGKRAAIALYKAGFKVTRVFFGARKASCAAAPTSDFHVIVERVRTGKKQTWTKKGKTYTDRLVIGVISVNGKVIGETRERLSMMIQPGNYRGMVRSTSGHAFVQGPGGVLAQKGDFLLEAAGVTWPSGRKRFGILFHTGTRPRHSRGCILLGAPHWKGGVKTVGAGSPLARLRHAFYGTDTPCACPERHVFIHVIDHRNKKASEKGARFHRSYYRTRR